MTLQTALKQLKAEMQINQKDLAKLIGIDVTTLNRWEKGRNKAQRVSSLLLLNFAKERGVSEGCQNALRDALFPNYRIEAEVNDLRTTEINRINELVNDSSNGVIVIDMNTFDVLYANNRMLAIEDYLIEEVKGMKCYQFLMHTEERCSNCQECCGIDGDKEYEFSSPRSGRSYLVRSKQTVWCGKFAQIKYITDITEMNKMRQETEFLRESLHLAVSHAKMAVFIYDIKSHKARLISTDKDNPEMPEKLDNFPQVVYENDMIDSDSVMEYKRMVQAIENGNKYAEAVVKIKLGDGIYHWTKFNMQLTKCDENGNPEMAVCSGTQIDKEKSLERRIKFEHKRVLKEGKGLLTYVVSNLSLNRVLECKYIEGDELPQVEGS